jgi:hypothetical protein
LIKLKPHPRHLLVEGPLSRSASSVSDGCCGLEAGGPLRVVFRRFAFGEQPMEADIVSVPNHDPESKSPHGQRTAVLGRADGRPARLLRV